MRSFLARLDSIWASLYLLSWREARAVARVFTSEARSPDMGYHCVVLAKQVPDTKRITGQAMKDDGTVNRAALPAVFNPEDLNALEAALTVRDRYGGRVTVITMGLPQAGEVLREALYRGVDEGILLTDRRCAGSDTLATSYILSRALRKIGDYDVIFCGRQAIDGDTAQVGPQLAEKLGVPQITSVEELMGIENGWLRARRNLGNGYEVVEGPLPLLLTLTSEANTPRPAAARKLMRFKHAAAMAELARRVDAEMETAADEEREAELYRRCERLKGRGLLLTQWGLDDIEADLSWCGLSGSPTKVHRVQSVKLAATEYKKVEPTTEGVRALIHELIEDHTLG
jgi:electron transfer flavoprotein beta subunit